jgi:predicted DNA-binding transcriptional regulator AlpA
MTEQQNDDTPQRHHLHALHPDTLLTKHEVAQVCGFSVSTLDRLPDAPSRIQLSKRRIAWRLGDVLRWLSTRKE